MCMVTPMERRSLTRMTLLMTSRPRSSKTRTFQIGLPSLSRMGATGASRPLARASSVSLDSTVSLRLRIFLREAMQVLDMFVQISGAGVHSPTWRSRRELLLDAIVCRSPLLLARELLPQLAGWGKLS